MIVYKFGRIKYFNSAKNFGFITEKGKEGQREGLYFDRRGMDGSYKMPINGDHVTFIIAKTKKGPKAENISLIRTG